MDFLSETGIARIHAHEDALARTRTASAAAAVSSSVLKYDQENRTAPCSSVPRARWSRGGQWALEIRPFTVGGTGVQSYSEAQPGEYPTRLEAGTLNGHGLAGLSAALDFLAETGIEHIHTHGVFLPARRWRPPPP